MSNDVKRKKDYATNLTFLNEELVNSMLTMHWHFEEMTGENSKTIIDYGVFGMDFLRG